MRLLRNYQWRLDMTNQEIDVAIRCLLGEELTPREVEEAERLGKIVKEIRDRKRNNWNADQPNRA